jgi:hypothetical protein
MAGPLILHYHLFKNAGTSVDGVLHANFGERWRNHDTQDPAASILHDEAARVIEDNPDLDALSSHQIRPPLPTVDRPVIPIVFLRHPLDRIRSIYSFDRRRGPVTPAAVLASRYGFADYIDAARREGRHLVENGQAMLLTDAWDAQTRRRLPIGVEGHGARAEAFLAALPVVGVVERYDASWAALATLIEPHHPAFSVDARAANVDGERAGSLEERLDLMRAELGEDRYDELVDINAVDFRLYELAQARLADATGGLAHRPS